MGLLSATDRGRGIRAFRRQESDLHSTIASKLLLIGSFLATILLIPSSDQITSSVPMQALFSTSLPRLGACLSKDKSSRTVVV